MPSNAPDSLLASGSSPIKNGEELLLEITGLNSHYGPVQVIHGISLSVHAGELVALVGGNGAGKTTLLHTLSSLHPPSAGTIRFDGHDITRWPSHRIVAAGICQVPEGRQVFAPLSVEDNLRLGAYRQHRNTGWIRHEMERVYHLFPILHERRQQLAGTLSGGQQQMLAIGRALLGRPRLLLLDEPSMGLAPLLVEEIFRVIVELNTQGVTILLVEQNARAALAIAGRGYILETGRIVKTAPASELLADDDVRRAYLGY
ncbi:MAG: ABC transporter ATP-binding protein [Candidatus Competibacteraceae bacterium]|nr:ABC transporter ATP-binding protein [Candidatus Competibacteraceae bacterium]